MSKNERYIIMQPPYTLDKWKDGAAQVRSEKEFQELVNYIPYDGSIITREGILTLTHTPQTTDPGVPFPESGSAPTPGIITNGTAELCRCRMVLDFERGNDYIGWNSMLYATGLNPIFTAMKCPNYIDNETLTIGQATCVGAGLASAKAGSNKLIIDSAPATNIYASSPAKSYGLFANRSESLPDWLFTGTSEKTCVLYTYWMWPYYKNANEDDHIVVIHSTLLSGKKHSLIMRHYDDDYQIEFMVSNGGTISDDLAGAITNAQRWYFCAGWLDIPNQTHGIYIYDDVAKTEIWTANKTITIDTTHHLWGYPTSSALLSIGGSRYYDAVGGGYRVNDSETLRGQLDYITYWDTIPSVATSVITLIRLIRDLHKS